MKILLDENFPVKLKNSFPGHEVLTVGEMSWKGKKNGELLKLRDIDEFDVLVTIDKNFAHEQNLDRFSVKVIIITIKDTRIEKIRTLVPKVIEVLNRPLNKLTEIF